jgi:hypothetical protein
MGGAGPGTDRGAEVNTANQEAWTAHASERAAQRAVRPEAVATALTWGTEFPQPFGRTAYFLDAAAISRAARAGDDVARWANTPVVAGDDGGVITVIRTTDVQRLKQFGQPARRRPRR